MTNESILLKPAYLELGKNLSDIILVNQELPDHKIVISIAGESGSGKSVTAKALQAALMHKGIKSEMLSMDNYFKLPPKVNHLARMCNISQVGPQEVNLELLQLHINSFKEGIDTISLPLTNYQADSFHIQEHSFEKAQVLIIEGTYVFTLRNTDFNIFINRTYHQTKTARTERNRDVMTDFVEQVLEIEHHIIKKGAENANLIIDSNYQIHQR
jgi:uridine kinase